MAHTLTKIPKIGDVVLCDGEFCVIIGFGGIKNPAVRSLKPVQTFEEAIGVAFKGSQRLHKMACSQLRYDDELKKWYPWGRALSFEQKAKVIELRDDGQLPARKARRRGMAPAGGEHLNLWKALFSTIAPIGDQKIADYTRRFNEPLSEGYAEPDANDSFVKEA